MQSLLFIAWFLIGSWIFVLPVTLGVIFSKRHTWTRRRVVMIATLLFFTILINPFAQLTFLEPLDTRLNNQWKERAEAHVLNGKNPDEVRALLGRPICEWKSSPSVTDADGNITWVGKPSTVWEYKPLPLYLMGSHFQVFFTDGKVTGFEANDD